MNLLLLTALASLSRDAAASVPDLVGEGPANVALGSASTALANDAYAPYYNPAGITQLRRVTMSAAPVLGQALLSDFSGIVYDTNGDGLLQDALGVPDYGPVGTDYRVPLGEGVAPFYTNGVQFGLVVPIRRVLAFGISGYMPGDALLRASVADPTIPYYVMFADRNNVFAVNPALAVQPVQGLSIGVGAQVMAGIDAEVKASVHANVSAFSGEEGAKSVEGQVQADIDQLDLIVAPDFRLNAGFLLDLSAFTASRDPERVERLARHALGVTWRGKWLASTSASVTANVTGQVQLEDETLLLSQLVEEPISLELKGLNAFFNPPQLAVGFRTGIGDVRDAQGRLESTPRLLLVADATWTQWSSFRDLTAPYQELTIDSLEGTSFTVTVGQDYGAPNFRDTLSYRGGLQVSTGPIAKAESIGDLQLRLRAGGQWIPTPVPAQTGLTNYMDSDRVVGTAGLGLEVAQLKPWKKYAPLTQGPVSLDLGGQFHYLLPRAQQKADDLIADSDGDGIPEYVQGYPLGGQIVSGGVYWAATAGISLQIGEAQRRPAPMRGWSLGAVDFPQPTAVGPAETDMEGAGDRGESLAVPVKEDGAPAHDGKGRKSRADRKAERAAKKAAKQAEEGAEGAAPVEGVEGAAPAEGVEAAPAGEATEEKPKKEKRKGRKKKEEAPAEGDQPAEGAAPAEGVEPAAEEPVPSLEAPLDELTKEELKARKKAEKERKKEEKRLAKERKKAEEALEDEGDAELHDEPSPEHEESGAEPAPTPDADDAGETP